MEGLTPSSLVANYPEIAAVVVLVIGLIIAKLAQRQAARLLGLLDRLVSRYATSESTVVSPEIARLSQLAVFWVLTMITVLIALQILDDGQLSGWFDSTLLYVPRVIFGILIIGVGHVLGVLVAYFLSHFSDILEPTSAGPRIVQALVLLIAIVLGLQQMLIDITFITQLLLILLLIIGGGLSLSFALGSKHFVANVVAQSEVNRFNIGDRIRIDDVEGEIIEKSSTTIRLETDEGIVSVPCMRFLQTTVFHLRDESNE